MKRLHAVIARAIAVIAIAAGLLVLFGRGWQFRGRGGLEPAAQIASQVSARAAELANDAFEQRFGKRPFRPDSYDPQLKESRWYWGRFEPASLPVRGGIVVGRGR
jgi:hypothetical protein